MISNLIVLGAEVFSGNWGINFNKKEIEKILLYSNDYGINEIDTASSYNNNYNLNKVLGEIIKNNKLSYKIASKFKINKSKEIDVKTIISNVKKDIDQSLKNFKKDFLDIYYFHSGTNEEFFNDELWFFLNEQVKSGLIKKLGLSIKHDLVISNDLKQLYNFDKYNISIVQTVLNLYSQESLKNLIPYCKENKLIVYSRMPLAKGLLTNKYNKNSKFSNSDPRYNKKITKQILNFKSKNKNLSLEDVVKWPLQHTNKIVLSVKNITQIKEIINIK